MSEINTEYLHKCLDNRNSTAHDYGEQFAKETLILVDDFLKDTEKLIQVIEND